MPSKLKWRTGFDWGVVVLAAGAGIGAALSGGPARWALASLALLSVAYMVQRYWSWNRNGWRCVHHRAMLAYAGIVGRGVEHAQGHGESFEIADACTALGLLLCGDDNRPVVESMVADLMRAQGGYLAGLVERHGREALPGAPFEFHRELLVRLRQMPLGPELVIAMVVENIYGGVEATRYAVALATGELRA